MGRLHTATLKLPRDSCDHFAMGRLGDVGLIDLKGARSNRRLVGVLAVLLGACACSGSGAAGQAKACTPGTSIACACTNASEGAQTCTADGTGYGTCICTGAGSAGAPGGPGGMLGGEGGAPTGAGGAAAAGGSQSSGGGGDGSAGQTGTGMGGRTGAAGMLGGGGFVTGSGGTVSASGGHAVGPDGGTPDGPITPSDASISADGGGGGYRGRSATVLVEDAVIGPGKEDGSPWDPGFSIPAGVFSDLATALGAADPLAAALGVLAEPLLTQAIDASQKPDVYGTIRLDVGAQVGTEYWLASRDQRTEDNFTPIFPGPVGFQHVPIDSDVRLRVLLADADLLDDDDPIDVAVINADDMKAALTSKKKYEVPVWNQTANQILFIGISVLQE